MSTRRALLLLAGLYLLGHLIATIIQRYAG